MTIPNAPAAPITVNGSTLPATLAAALRYLLTIIGTAAVSAGWVKPENVEGIITIIATLATAAYGLWRTNHKQGQLIAVADHAPNDIAKVK